VSSRSYSNCVNHRERGSSGVLCDNHRTIAATKSVDNEAESPAFRHLPVTPGSLDNGQWMMFMWNTGHRYTVPDYMLRAHCQT
jgi:hypothetical protein